jgi:hypothetical protein
MGHFAPRGDDPRFHVISDTIEPFRSMADNRIYDSKSRYRRDLKARGLVEVGNENITQRRVELPPVKAALKEAYERLSNR